MIEFYIFRHGETDWNLQRRFQGFSDISLNSTGLLQAKNLQPKIEQIRPQLILSSDLTRALKTAEIASSSLHLKIQTSPQLRECHLGELEGMFRDDIIEKYGSQILDLWYSSKKEDLAFGFPGGETKAHHLKRLVSHLESSVNLNPQIRKFAVSTHGGSLQRLIYNCVNAPSEAVIVTNCSLHQLHFDPDQGSWFYQGEIN